jgi:DNA end-binding protein Ku
MASATKKASVLTTLQIGTVQVPVGLFSTVASPSKLAQFDTAGPNGGVLKAQPVARAVPVAETPVDVPDVGVQGDPLGDDPGPETGSREDLERVAEMTGGTVHDLSPDAPAYQYMPSSEPPAPVLPDAPVDGQYGRELVEEGSGVVVLPQDVRRGVRLEDGRFIDCTAQLAQIEDETRLDRITVIGFVDATQIPRVRVKGAQYLGAADEAAPRALRIMYEALKGTRRMALVKLTKRSRQTLGVIGVSRGVLMLLELVWAEDFREPPARATRIQKEQVSAAEVGMFAELVHAMAVPMSVLEELRDDAIAKREELREKAERGEVAEILLPTPADPAEDLMAQLEASLAGVTS